ncbi:uncharacterized protein LOC127095439 [Lathyrus oleraceus]|uniref:uncharacterized protein LOC127095439 n=1 Tax=Pisum sativum TaxID=3888 RepID=UPI0021CFA676|nr:uncharacterized protein LOC127095439 [Pisum sativum]
MDQLEQNQDALREEVSQVRVQMGQLMDIIQAVARGKEIMAKIQKEMNQRAHAIAATPATIPVTIENLVPPKGNTPVQILIGAPDSVPPPFINPLIIEIDDQQDAFFSPRVASVYDTFGPSANKVEKKVRAIEEKLKAMEGSSAIGFDAAEMCLVPSVVIPSKFKAPDFEKYKGASDPRTRVKAYFQNMTTYSDDDRFLMHFFQDNLSGASLDWYMQLE